MNNQVVELNNDNNYKKDILIYIDNYEIENDETVRVYYELIDENCIRIIEEESFVEVQTVDLSSSVTNLEELDKWNNSFVYFEIFDIKQNGFLNALKGGNKTKARKLNAKLISIKKRLLDFTRIVIDEMDTPPSIIGNWFYCVLNVGRGESNLIISPNGKCYLFDGGDSKQSVLGKVSNVIDYINKKFALSITLEISGLFISHPDNDHFRGVIDVIKSEKLTEDCFIYFNYHNHYPKTNWTTALSIITNAVSSGGINRIIDVPKKDRMADLNRLIPGLFLKSTWPYDIGKNISKINGYTENNASHCIYIGMSENSLMLSLLGDVEKKGWEKNGDISLSELNGGFIYKLPHHGRKSGDPVVKFSGTKTVSEYLEALFSASLASPNYVISGQTNLGKIFSPIAAKALVSGHYLNGLIYEISSTGIASVSHT